MRLDWTGLDYCRRTDIRIADFGQKLGREPQSHRSETLSPDNRFEYFLLIHRFLFILILPSGVQSAAPA
jgi:hypothetical protein